MSDSVTYEHRGSLDGSTPHPCRVIHREGGRVWIECLPGTPGAGQQMLVAESEVIEIPPTFEVGKSYRGVGGASVFTVVEIEGRRLIGWELYDDGSRYGWVSNQDFRCAYTEVAE